MYSGASLGILARRLTHMGYPIFPKPIKVRVVILLSGIGLYRSIRKYLAVAPCCLNRVKIKILDSFVGNVSSNTKIPGVEMFAGDVPGPDAPAACVAVGQDLEIPPEPLPSPHHPMAGSL